MSTSPQRSEYQKVWIKNKRRKRGDLTMHERSELRKLYIKLKLGKMRDEDYMTRIKQLAQKNAP